MKSVMVHVLMDTQTALNTTASVLLTKIAVPLRIKYGVLLETQLVANVQTTAVLLKNTIVIANVKVLQTFSPNQTYFQLRDHQRLAVTEMIAVPHQLSSTTMLV